MRQGMRRRSNRRTGMPKGFCSAEFRRPKPPLDSSLLDFNSIAQPSTGRFASRNKHPAYRRCDVADTVVILCKKAGKSNENTKIPKNQTAI